jgi:outer membrane protein
MKMTVMAHLTILIIAPFIYAQDSLTVEQAVQRVLQTHPAIQQILAVGSANEARVQTASSAKYPDIAVEGLYSRIGPVPELTIPHMGSFKFYPENNYDAHVAARYTVFDFGRTDAAIDVSRSRVQSSQDAVEMTKTGLAMQTIRTFYSILFLQKSLQVGEEQIQTLNQHLTAAQNRVAAGTATNFDILTTEVRVVGAQSQKIDINNALQRQECSLRQLLNYPADKLVRIRGEFNLNPVNLQTDSLFALARRQRTELSLARDAEHTAELQVRLSSLGDRPSLKVNLVYGFKNGYIPHLDRMQDNWVAAIKAEMPIFDGGRISHQEEEARANLLAEQSHLQDVERQIRSEIEQTVVDVQAAQAKVQISQTQLEQAHQAVELARTRYETGSVTNLDLLDAETVESAAKLSHIQALYRYAISRYELDHATGNPLY